MADALQVVWFKRDLRVQDHAALAQAAQRGPVLPLPSKLCATCGRPFSWRKKWSRVWDEVKYCSDRCRAAK